MEVFLELLHRLSNVDFLFMSDLIVDQTNVGQVGRTNVDVHQRLEVSMLFSEFEIPERECGLARKNVRLTLTVEVYSPAENNSE